VEFVARYSIPKKAASLVRSSRRSSLYAVAFVRWVRTGDVDGGVSRDLLNQVGLHDGVRREEREQCRQLAAACGGEERVEDSAALGAHSTFGGGLQAPCTLRRAGSRAGARWFPSDPVQR
jgi:hypothetical protein